MNALATLVEGLRMRGVIPADAPVPEILEHDRPWFIAALQGIAGWLAGIFLLVFIAMIVEPDSTAGLVVCGAVLLASAWGLYYAGRNAVFLDQFALALSIAGQFALAAAVVKDVKMGVAVAALLLLLQCVVFGIMPNKIARTLAAFFASIAWIYMVRLFLRPGHDNLLFADDNFLFESARLGGASVPVGWVVTWAPLIFATWWLVRRETSWMATGARVFARPLLSGLLLGLALGGIVTEPLSLFALGVQEMGVPFSLWSLFPLLSISLAVYVAHCAFRVQSYAVLGLAIVAALVHLSRFYYLYGTTLMWKSALMLLVGAALLLIGYAMHKRAEQT